MTNTQNIGIGKADINGSPKLFSEIADTLEKTVEHQSVLLVRISKSVEQMHEFQREPSNVEDANKSVQHSGFTGRLDMIRQRLFRNEEMLQKIVDMVERLS